MKDKNWGWWTAWLNLIGQFAIVAGINYAAALFLNAAIVTPLTGGPTATPPRSGSAIRHHRRARDDGRPAGHPAGAEHRGINVVALLNQVSVWWHIVFVVAIVGPAVRARQARPAGLTLFAIQPQDAAGQLGQHVPSARSSASKYGPAVAYPLFLAFFFSLLQANWTYTGYDASAHVAEETVGARMASAWGIFLSVAVSAVVGYIFLFALTLHLPNLSPLFPADLTADPAGVQPVLLRGRRGGRLHPQGEPRRRLGDVLGGRRSRSRCASAAFRRSASAGRMLFAFSRDDGIPGSGWLKKVSHRYRTPANALTAIVVVSFLFTVVAFIVGTRHGDRHRDRHQHDLPVRRLRPRDLPRRDDRRLEAAPSLEPGPLVRAGGLDRGLLGAGPDGPVLVPDVGQHLVAVHDRRRSCCFSCTTSAGHDGTSRARRSRVARPS